MTPAQVASDMRAIIQKMIEAGLSNQQHFPVLTNTGSLGSEIGIAGAPSLSISMKNLPYLEIYRSLDEGGAYHVRMIDGALLQMCYRFHKKKIVAHRLCMFPVPHLENYDTDPDSYEKDELYADIVGKNIVHIPIRFDFDADAKIYVDVKSSEVSLYFGAIS